MAFLLTKTKNINMTIQESESTLSTEKEITIQNYLAHMNEREKKAYLIALHHLGTSFNIYKSNGFKEWLKKKNEK